jgi:hypothetical protein
MYRGKVAEVKSHVEAVAREFIADGRVDSDVETRVWATLWFNVDFAVFTPMRATVKRQIERKVKPNGR